MTTATMDAAMKTAISTAAMPRLDGVHLIGDLYDCCSDAALLQQLSILEPHVVAAAVHADMLVVGQRFHQFEPAGVTGVVLLAESHVAVHTWPEHRYVTLDVYVCNHTGINRQKAEVLFKTLIDLFKPDHYDRVVVERGRRMLMEHTG